MALPIAILASRRQKTAPTLPFGWGAVTVLAVGAILTIIGIIVIIYGMIQFFTGTIGTALSDEFSIGSFFSGFFGAFILLVIGAMITAVGGWMIRLWWLFLLFGAVAGGGGADTVRGREEAQAGAVRIRCRACGRLNPEEAKFCLSCGQAV